MRHPVTVTTDDLCYLDASKVKTPAGVLSEVDVLSPDAQPLGSIRGIVIEAQTRRLRYLDVQAGKSDGRHRYLVDAAEAATIDPASKSLRLREPVSNAEVPLIDPETIRPFSDDDLLAAMFSSSHAA